MTEGKTDMAYTEEEVGALLFQAVDLGARLEAVLRNAKAAASDGDREKTAACMERANALMARIGSLGTQDCRPGTGRPPAEIPEGADMTPAQVRNCLRLRMPVGELARGMGISESTFRRRMRRAQYIPGEVMFSRIP